MKVLVVSHMYPAMFDSFHNGTFVHRQVKELKRQGCEVRVVSPKPYIPPFLAPLRNKWKQLRVIPERRIEDGVEIHYPRYLALPRSYFMEYSGYFMWWGIRKLVDEIYQDFKFDIIHAHVALPSGFAAMKLRESYHKPLVLTIHGQDLNQTIFRNIRCLKAIKRVFAYSDKVITVSNKLKRVAEGNVGHTEKIAVINNGIDLEEAFKGESELKAKYQNRTIVLSVSGVHRSKGIDLNLRALAKAISKHSDVIYLIIGEGRERGSLEQLVSKLNLETYVEFVGEVPHRKAMEYISICDIFSLPSWSEGFGIVYLEAMAHGKPVIGVRGEGIEDVITNGETGFLVTPRDVGSLAKTLIRLLADPDLRSRAGARAQELVREKYTLTYTTAKIVRLYAEIYSRDNWENVE